MNARQRHLRPTRRARPLPGRLVRTRLGPTVGALLAWAGAATPMAAQWSRVTELPADNVFALSVEQDTIAAATRTVVFVSTDGGVHWQPSARPAPSVTSIQAVRLVQGQLFAGTCGHGAFG